MVNLEYVYGEKDYIYVYVSVYVLDDMLSFIKM
jgi:hypothetical protein